MVDFLKAHKSFIKTHFFTIAFVSLFGFGFFAGILVPLLQTIININSLTMIALVLIVIYFAKRYYSHN